MDPLNKKERTEAFIKVMLLFLLTVTILAIPMYYAFRMPATEKAVNDKELANLKDGIRQGLETDVKFLALADSAQSLYVQYTKESVEAKRDRLSDRLSTVLNAMEDLSRTIEKDTARYDLYGHVVNAYGNLVVKNDDVNELKAELKKAAEKAEGGGGGGGAAAPSGDDQMKKLITSTLAKHNGNKKEAAKELGMTERKLKKKMEELGM
jgi:chromosome segregation ATPase